MNQVKDSNIHTIEFSDEMEQSYIDYSMSVIMQRAVPDLRDGLKPVQRRVLYSMKELGLNHDVSYKKCARIVGDAMGKYHPHGDSSIYDALVGLSKNWTYNNPLVDGHGNFGSIEGDGAAAMRYTEARLTEFAEKVYLQDLEKGVVKKGPNFDETEIEPEVLPVKIPNILVNGTDGIAVGMATKIPTHNLGEVIDALIALMKKEKITTSELMEHIQGPDFPTGGVVANKDELLSIYETGVGKIKIRGKAQIKKEKSGKQRIEITQIPQTMINNIEKFMEKIADLYRNKEIEISDIQNQSSGTDIKIVIDLKKNSDANEVLNILYKKAKLEDTIGVNMLVINNGKPMIMGLKDIISEYYKFLTDVYTKKYTYMLEKEQHKREIREGLIKAIDCIDLIIEVLRGSKKTKDAKACLVNGDVSKVKFKTKKSELAAKALKFTDVQADAILDMKLSRLIGLEILNLKKDLAESEKNIELYNGYLTSKIKMRHLIEKELLEIKAKYSTKRKTVIKNEKEVILKKRDVKECIVYALIDRFGYIKTIDSNVYEKNKENIPEDIKYVIRGSNLGKFQLFTRNGKLLSIKAENIPEGKIRDKGIPIDNLTGSDMSNEEIIFTTSTEECKKCNIISVTSKGLLRQVESSEFNVSKRIVEYIKLPEDDYVAGIVKATSECSECIIFTTDGRSMKVKVKNIKKCKRTGVGNKSINVSKGLVNCLQIVRT